MHTILFVDNNPDFLDACSEYLEPDYQVIRAYSLDEARDCLATQNVHLAILDVRLINDDDERDTSGLVLAKEPAYHSLPKIILTKWPTYEGVREVLAPVLEGMPPAVGYVSKRELPEGLLQAVEEAFRRYVCINQGLAIRFAEPAHLSWAHLATAVGPNLDSSLLPCRVAEMEDLLRKLFCDRTQLTLGSLLWARPGRACVTAWAHDAEGASDAFAVAIGLPSGVAEEAARFRKWAPSGAAGKPLVPLAETLHWQAAGYLLAGAEWAEAQPFADYYATEAGDGIQKAIVNLCLSHLTAWAKGERSVSQGTTLPALCRELAPAVQVLTPQALQDLAREAVALPGATLRVTAESVELCSPHGPAVTYPHPLAALESISAQNSAAPVTCPAPGRLTGENVLVGIDGRTWLTDYSAAGLLPVQWALSSLEAALRYDMLQCMDMRALHTFEARLLQPQRLSDHLDAGDIDQPFRKALGAIQQVRHCASALAADDPASYHICLLYLALDRLAAYQPGVRYSRTEYARFVHTLLSAAMTCQRLLCAQSGGDPRQGFVIDLPNRRVCVEGREVTLGGAEFDVLVYLYNHAGQLCTRRALVEEALGEVYANDEQEVGRLNTLISRLRSKVEPDPDHPRYVRTVRGGGYQFVTGETGSL